MFVPAAASQRANEIPQTKQRVFGARSVFVGLAVPCVLVERIGFDRLDLT